jgi:TolB protein
MLLRLLLALVAALGLVVLVEAAPADTNDGLVAFTTGGGEEPSFIWTVRPDGSDRRRLIGPRKKLFRLGASGPEWSPDGRRLLFGGHWRLDDHPRTLWYATAAGKRITRIPLGLGGPMRSPRAVRLLGWDWSPNGRRVVVSVRHGAAPRSAPMMYTISIDGSRRRALRRGWSPQWSSDGRHIVFSLIRPPEDPLYGAPRHLIGVVRPDGGGFRRLTPFDHDAEPSLSPDGTRVVFIRNANLPGNREEWHIVGIDGSGDVLVPRPTGDFGWSAPWWTPDGERLAVVRSEPGDEPHVDVSKLVTADLTGGDVEVHLRFPRQFPLWPGFADVSWQPR